MKTPDSNAIAPANLGDLVRRDVPGERLALIDLREPEQWLSCADLDRGGEAFCARLLALGFRPGERIAILAENCAEFLIAYMGVMRAGCVAVPTNYRLPLDTVRFILLDSDVKLCVVDPARSELCPRNIARLVIRPENRSGFAPPLDGEPPRTRPQRPKVAQILYTSGSTGRPKGVELSHEGQLWAIGVHVKQTPSIDDRALIVAPFYHMNGLFNLSVALLNAVQVVLMPRFDARAYLQAVAHHGCTSLSGIPTMFAMMARQADLLESLDLSGVRAVSIGSAPLTEALAARVLSMFPNAALRNGYGSTEAGPTIFGDHPSAPTPLLSLGHPRADVGVRLVGGVENEGVLEVRTPAMFSAYLNLPEVTRAKLHDGWYSSGDIMRRDEAGFFYFVGRADDMFTCGGENVYPGEIEKMLERHPSVLQAAVVPVPDEIKGQIPIAFVVLSDPRTSMDELTQFTLREGPAYSHPRAFVVVEELPLATTHKVDKRPLLARALEAGRSLRR